MTHIVFKNSSGGKKPSFYAAGFAAVAVILTAVIFLTNSYVIIPTNIPHRTILDHIISDDSALFLKESSSYSSSMVSRFTHIWTAVFLPMLAAIPYLLLFASEMKGNYRMVIARIGCFNKYWNRVFFKAGLLGAGCVTAGYAIFSATVFSYFPHMSEYPAEAPASADIFQTMAVRRPLSGILNNLFGNTESELLYWIPWAINIFAYSFLVAILCLLLYLLIMNRYKAIGMPMIVFYLVEQFATRKMIDTLNPKYQILSPRSLMINAEYTFSNFGINGFGYLIFFALASVIMYLAGRALFRKRVMN